MDYTEIEIEGMKEILRDKEKEINRLTEENKKLHVLKCVPSNLKTLIRIDKENEWLEQENKKLNGKIRFLEQCLDNKEKVNKSLREELEWYHGFDNYLTNHGFDMKNLKEKIKNQN